MSRTLSLPLRSMRSSALIGPATALFVSANIANAANLAFNMVFARIMGPAAFADLTLLLTLKLGVLSFLGALQFAIAERTAKEPQIEQSRWRGFDMSWRSLKVSVPAMFLVMALANYLATALNFSSPMALVILAIAVPFFLPMIIYRGLAQGLVDLPRIIVSIQAEWLIRLLGSVLLWQAGFGLPGIAAAVGLSILAGFAFSTQRRDWQWPGQRPGLAVDAQTRALGLATVPYLILQFAQVLVLDSDIFLAKISFSADTAGLVAGLLLIQRVFFFAFLSCSTILQPLVARQSEKETSASNLFLLLAAVAIITALALAVVVPNSAFVVGIMLGDSYSALTSVVWISALTGAVFMASHLCAIYQIARGRSGAAIVVLVFGLLQLGSLFAINHIFAGLEIRTFFGLKLVIQLGCLAVLMGMISMSRKTDPKP